MNHIRRTITLTFLFYLVRLLSDQLLANENKASCLSQALTKELQNYDDKTIEVLAPEDKNSVLNLTTLFGDKNQVLLGMGKGGHFYLMVGNMRIDGGPIKETKLIQNHSNSDGYLIHFPNIPEDKIKEWRVNMVKSGSDLGFALSCVHAACSALKDGFGIKVNNIIVPNIFLSSTLEKIIKNGFVDQDGRPVQIQIYRTSQRVPEFEKLKTKYEGVDNVTSTPYIAVFIGLPASLIGMITIVVIKHELNKYKAQK